MAEPRTLRTRSSAGTDGTRTLAFRAVTGDEPGDTQDFDLGAARAARPQRDRTRYITPAEAARLTGEPTDADPAEPAADPFAKLRTGTAQTAETAAWTRPRTTSDADPADEPTARRTVSAQDPSDEDAWPRRTARCSASPDTEPEPLAKLRTQAADEPQTRRTASAQDPSDEDAWPRRTARRAAMPDAEPEPRARTARTADPPARRASVGVQGEGRAGYDPDQAPPALTPDTLPPPPDMKTIADTLKSMKFRKAIVGGVEEADVWRQLETLQRQYQAVFDAQRAYYKALLDERDRALARQMRRKGGG